MDLLPQVRCRDCATVLGPQNRHGLCMACHRDRDESTERADKWGVPVEYGHFSEQESASETSYRSDEPYDRRYWWEEM